MADTTFVDGNLALSNRIVAAWLNDVNNLRYGAGNSARGAALLQFIQAGTGATTRDAQSKAREFVSLFDFMSAAQIADVQAGTALIEVTAAINAALAYAHATCGGVYAPAGTYLTGEIDWPGNNITLRGAGSAYSYNTSAAPKTVFQAKAATTIVFDLVQTGTSNDRTGNHLVDLEVDGNSIATVGINCSGANIIERVRVRRCTTAGVRLQDFTNSTRIVRCGLSSNTGWGLLVEGAATTAYSVEGSVFSLNTLGGALVGSGVLAGFRGCVFESNAGPGTKIYRDTVHTGTFGNLVFHECWWEDNGSAAPNFSIEMDAYNNDALRAITNVEFIRCRLNPSVVTRKYLLCGNVNNVVFKDCSIQGSTASDAITLDAQSVCVAFIECANSFGGESNHLTPTQIDNALAQGTRCYSSDTGVKRAVGSGSPAAGFTNSWANTGGTRPAAAYWFDHEGYLCIEGTIDTGTVTSSAFTLPVGYRPAVNYIIPATANDAFANFEVNAAGTVVPRVGSNVAFQLNARIRLCR